MTNQIPIKDISDKELASYVRAIGASTTINRRGKEHMTTFDIVLAQFPLVALERFITYGAQRCFNDAIGGADKTPESKVETVKLMIEEYQAGEVSKRRISAPVDNVQVVTRQLARAALRAMMAEQNVDFKAFTELARDVQNEKLDMIIDNNDDLIAQAKKKIADRKTASKGLDLATLGLANKGKAHDGSEV